MPDQAKLASGPNSDNWPRVDYESMIERACWINYKPVTDDYWPIGRGFIQAGGEYKRGTKLHVSHVHHAYVPGPSHPGRLHPLDRRPPLDGGQVVFDSDTFRGSLHAGRACWTRGSLSKFWHTAGISELVNRTRGGLPRSRRRVPLDAHSEVLRQTLNKRTMNFYYR